MAAEYSLVEAGPMVCNAQRWWDVDKGPCVGDPGEPLAFAATMPVHQIRLGVRPDRPQIWSSLGSYLI